MLVVLLGLELGAEACLGCVGLDVGSLLIADLLLAAFDESLCKINIIQTNISLDILNHPLEYINICNNGLLRIPCLLHRFRNYLFTHH